MTKQADNSPLVRLCGLWEHTSRAGMRTYLTGRLNRATRLLVFKNNNRQKPTDPDWTLFLRQDDPEDSP